MKRTTGRLLEWRGTAYCGAAVAESTKAYLGEGSLQVRTANGTFETLGTVPTASLFAALGFIPPPRQPATIRFKDGRYAKGFILPSNPGMEFMVSIEVTEVGHERDREGAD